MIQPDGFRGAAFGTAADGDGRHVPELRATIARDLDISEDWATIRQVHGNAVLIATEPGFIGAADGLITEVPGLPLAVATADCVPVIIEGAGSTAIVHAGWRGIAARIVERTVNRMKEIGDSIAAANGGQPPKRSVPARTQGGCDPDRCVRHAGHLPLNRTVWPRQDGLAGGG